MVVTLGIHLKEIIKKTVSFQNICQFLVTGKEKNKYPATWSVKPTIQAFAMFRSKKIIIIPRKFMNYE